MTIDERPAKRIVEQYRGINLYLILAYNDDGAIYDIQPSISGEAINPDQSTLSNIDALARMTALAVREYDPEYVAANLLQCARGAKTLPAILANAILEHGHVSGT